MASPLVRYRPVDRSGNRQFRVRETPDRDQRDPSLAEKITAVASASTQNQALSALLFLYREVYGRNFPWLDGIVRARRPKRLPVVLTRSEVSVLLNQGSRGVRSPRAYPDTGNR